MFKELDEFINHVGRTMERTIECVSSKKEDDGILMGYPGPKYGISDDELDLMCEHGLITEEERDALKSSKRYKIE